jgi:endonuclease YncB( thermonuclease family)
MAHVEIRNAGGVPFLTLKGFVVVRENQQPDGDTLSFCAAAPYKRSRVVTNVPVSTTGSTTVNVRLQSLDAPEKTQPYGASSRDSLLRFYGFDVASLGLGDDDFIAGPGLTLVRAWLATHGLDTNKRPLGYLFTKNPGFQHGEEVSAQVVGTVLKLSANHRMVRSGAAFPAFYENTDASHAADFKTAAEKARTAKQGVWALDTTTQGFVPTPDALGRQGALIYPKFYRRVAEWKTAKPDAAAFLRWLQAQADGQKLVLGAARDPLPLWRLFEVASKTRVVVPYDVNKLRFSE